MDFGPLDRSTELHGPHATQVERHANELKLGLHLVQTPHAELPESQDGLDPAIRWLDDPLALPIGLPAFIGEQLFLHGRRARILLGVDLYLLFAFSSQR